MAWNHYLIQRLGRSLGVQLNSGSAVYGPPDSVRLYLCECVRERPNERHRKQPSPPLNPDPQGRAAVVLRAERPSTLLE